MARRKVNVRFLIILTVVVVIGGSTLLAAGLYKLNKRPQEFISTGDRLLAEGDRQQAMRNYGHAISLNPRNTELLLKYGDLAYELAGEDHENINRAVTAWRSALEVDPGFLPAG